MEKLTIEEAYQTILHDLDRLTENVLLLREACVQSKKITMEDVVEFQLNYFSDGSETQLSAVRPVGHTLILSRLPLADDDNEIGESERKTIDRLMTRLRTLVNATGVGILAIVHLKRPPGGESYNVGKEGSPIRRTRLEFSRI